MKKTGAYELDMTTGALLPKMLRFALPLMLSSLLQLLFNAVDVVVVGRFAGDNSLAAVGSNTALINLLTNLFVGLSVGANVLFARFYGAHKKKDLEETLHTAMALSLVSGILLTVIGVVGAKQILIWMQTPTKVLDLAVVYLRIYFLGMTATMVYNFGSAILRAVGDTKRPLHYLLFAGIVNVVFNLIFVICFKMDVAGVAIATVISQCISAGLVLRCLMHEDEGLKLNLRKLKIHKEKFLKILQIGLPAGFQGILFSLSNVVVQSSINLFGEIVIAGSSAASSLEGFVFMGMNAFHQAAISFMGQNIGAGKYERINRILYTAELCVFVVGLVFGNAVVLFGPKLLGVYSANSLVIEAGMERLRIICSTYALCGMMDVMVGSLRGMG
jgi:putative MATE family efflux protein